MQVSCGTPGPDSGACQLKNDNLMGLGSVWYNIAQAGWVHWGWVMPRIRMRIATTALTSAAASESEGDELRLEYHDQCQCQSATVYRLTVRVHRRVRVLLSGVVIKG